MARRVVMAGGPLVLAAMLWLLVSRSTLLFLIAVAFPVCVLWIEF